MIIRGGNKMVHYCIDPGVEGILNLFALPHSTREVGEMLREITSASAEDSFFEELVEIGALVPAGRERVQSGAA
jgi:hypothetical protein